MSIEDYVVSRHNWPNELKVARPLLNSSMLGRYVRKCRLEYIKLDFEDAGFLWTALKQYRIQAVKDITVQQATDHFDSFGEMFPSHPAKSANFGSHCPIGSNRSVNQSKSDRNSLLLKEIGLLGSKLQVTPYSDCQDINLNQLFPIESH